MTKNASDMQNWVAQMNGVIDGVVLACTAMLATHPEREKVLETLQGLVKSVADAPQDTPETQSYKRGIRAVVERFAHGADTAQSAEQVRSQKKKGGLH